MQKPLRLFAVGESAKNLHALGQLLCRRRIVQNLIPLISSPDDLYSVLTRQVWSARSLGITVRPVGDQLMQLVNEFGC